jgi:hypothetical protein
MIKCAMVESRIRISKRLNMYRLLYARHCARANMFRVAPQKFCEWLYLYIKNDTVLNGSG